MFKYGAVDALVLEEDELDVLHTNSNGCFQKLSKESTVSRDPSSSVLHNEFEAAIIE